MASVIPLDTTTYAASINALSGAWVPYESSRTCATAVTIGKRYSISFASIDSAVVGGWWSVGLASTNTPSSQILKDWHVFGALYRNSFYEFVATDNYLVIGMNAEVWPDCLDYVVLTEYSDIEIGNGLGQLMQRRRELASDAVTKSLSDYVQTGIVFWLDGIENTRSGHNALSTKWHDLSGSGKDVTYNSSKVIGDKYCILNGKSTVSRVTGITTSYTIEVAVEQPTDYSVRAIMPWMGNAYGSVFTQSRYIYFRAAASGTNFKGMLFEQGIHTYSARGNDPDYFRVDGRTPSLSPEYQRSLGSAQNWMGYYSDSYPFPATNLKIYAIRIYNRKLSDEELLINSNADAVRFGR